MNRSLRWNSTAGLDPSFMYRPYNGEREGGEQSQRVYVLQLINVETNAMRGIIH